MPYRKATLRKAPPHARSLARLCNELESVLVRLRNRLETIQTLELAHRAYLARDLMAARKAQEHPRKETPQ